LLVVCVGECILDLLGDWLLVWLLVLHEVYTWEFLEVSPLGLLVEWAAVFLSELLREWPSACPSAFLLEWPEANPLG
jgi:hypothetical protein